VTPDTIEAIKAIAIIIASVLGVGGFGYLGHRVRSGRAQAAPQLQPAAPRAPLPSTPNLQGYPAAPPAGLVDPAGDTGRHDVSWMSDTQRNLQAPPMSAAELRQMAAHLEIVAKQSPATQGALESGLGTVGKQIDVLSEAVASVRESMLHLPCKLNPDDGCDVLKVPVTMPHPPKAHLQQVKP